MATSLHVEKHKTQNAEMKGDGLKFHRSHKEIMSLCCLFLMMNNATTLKHLLLTPDKNALCHRKATPKHKTQRQHMKNKRTSTY
jgi:hypothetical protein